MTCLPSGCCHSVTELNLTDNHRLLQNNSIQRTILLDNNLTTWATLANDKVYCLGSCFITPHLTTITNSSNQQVHSWQQLISPTSSMTTSTRRQVHISPSKWKWVSAEEMRIMGLLRIYHGRQRMVWTGHAILAAGINYPSTGKIVTTIRLQHYKKKTIIFQNFSEWARHGYVEYVWTKYIEQNSCWLIH